MYMKIILMYRTKNMYFLEKFQRIQSLIHLGNLYRKLVEMHFLKKILKKVVTITLILIQ